MIPITYTHGIRRDLVFTDEASGRTMDRPGWQDLMSRVQPGDTVVVAFLDRFSRNFEEGVAIQAGLTKPKPRWELHFATMAKARQV